MQEVNRGAASVSRVVMFIVDGLGVSGKTKALTDLACGLSTDRYQSVVVTFSKEKRSLVDRLEQEHIPVYEVPIEEGLRFENLWRLLRKMREVRPDVVHCVNQRAMLYGGIAARLLGIRATLGSLSAFASLVPDRTYEFLPQHLATQTRGDRFRNRLISRLMSRLTTVSARLGQRFCEFNGIPDTRMSIVPYGVATAGDLRDDPAADGRSRLRQEMRAEEGDVLVGSVGRLVEQKDYGTQLRGFAAAAEKDPRLRMILVGDGPLRGHLEEEVEELGVADRVTFLGFRADVRQLLEAIDIFALTSKFEPFGVAILEAKAAGLAIVATAVNQIPELLSYGKSGILVSPGSPEELADALIRLARDRSLGEELGRRAAEEALERHSLCAMIQAFEDLYDEVLGLSRTKGGSLETGLGS